MKIKLPALDKNALRDFAVEHVEKIVLGVIGVCCISIVYQAIRRESYNKGPAQLAETAANARKHVEQTQPVPMQIPDYPAIVARSRKPIKEDFYSLVQVPMPSAKQGKRKRTTPNLYAVRKLHGMADKGPFDLEPPPGFNATPAPPPTTRGRSRPATPPPKLEPPRGQRWIVVTGVVPLNTQFDDFAEAFRNSEYRPADPRKDQPEYLGYWVERAEVGPSGATGKLNWTKRMVSLTEREAAEKRWHRKAENEAVDKDLVLDKLVFPLGPLLGRDWGTEVAHLPEIPLKSKEEKKEKDKAEPKAAATAAPELDDTPFGDGARKPKPKPKEAAPKAVEGPPEFVLFRFFDFNVEPGKQYVYRVRLVLKNPNYGLDQRYLERLEYGRKKLLETDWSEPSNVISVPGDVQLLATEVKPEIRTGSPKGDLMIIRYDERRGEENQKTFEVVRGDVADYPKSRIRVQRKPPVYVTVDFLTGAVVLDLRGGGRMTDKERTPLPGEMLLLDADGKLVVHNTFDDLVTLERRRSRAPIETEDKAAGKEEPENPKEDDGLGALGGDGTDNDKK